MEILLTSLIIFIFGLCLGSFFNVVIYRLPKKQSIVSPASYCPECGTRLKVFDLVPVFSFLWRKGKCCYCQSSISWQYPLVEFITGLLYVLLFLKFALSSQFFIMLLLVSFLIIITVIDLKYMLIYNKLTYLGIIIGLILSLLFEHITFLNSLLGGLIPFTILLLLAIIFKNGLGMGDVKLVAMIGTFIGFPYTLLGIFLGSLIGTIISLPLIILGVVDRKTRIPFGPLISIGTVLMIFLGDRLLSWYLNLFL